ncbi:MAG TPA: tungstate ABC transporter substrate-binding protein WtpA [Dehalococcoidia bacterium]|nr:tungstate ABC transporter substrate-binding protein WtpA [Dehalococcoidia bacterium]
MLRLRETVRGKTAKISILLLLLALLPLTVANGACGSSRTHITVLCAGSLIVPFEKLAEEFEAAHPGIDVLVEGHGSIQVIREVTELHNEADVMVVADQSLLPMLMYGNKVPGGTDDYANWYIRFATNRLGLAYTSRSKYAAEITGANWYEVLSRPDVMLGISDPRIDSCGYRALMACHLAENYYTDGAIFESVMAGFSPPLTVNEESGSYVILVPQAVNSTKVTVRGYSVQLIGLLEAGELDYCFEYESVARQHGLEFVELPAEIDLSSSAFADLYAKVAVKMDFQRFASIDPEFRGEPIQYALTIPSNAPHPEAAAEFVEFILGSDGQEVLSESYQPTLVPPEADNPADVPSRLKRLVEE